MKKILTVYTGGTIGTSAEGGKRELNSAASRSSLAENFRGGASCYAPLADEVLEISTFPPEYQTLSESMTPKKLWRIIEHIRSYRLEDYLGVVVMHGTDTLAFSAAIFSVVFHNTGVPIMLVSGNRPPSDPLTNAHDNFRMAIELILDGISPAVYVPYRNSDGNIYLHLGSSIMQCPVFSEDFHSAVTERAPIVTFDGDNSDAKAWAREASKQRKLDTGVDIEKISGLSSDVLLIHPYTGLDYSRISLDGVKAVLHTTYHSGTVCTERCEDDEDYSTLSILYLADKCLKCDIPLFVAPTRLDQDQYSTMYDLHSHAKPTYLNMNVEMAYAKLMVGVSLGLSGVALTRFATTNIAGEVF